jgi:amidophosphoribosyltransferase
VEKEKCLFEVNYLKREEEPSGGTTIASRRIEMGKLLARTLPVAGDMIVPVPETGILFAQGYALESGIPLAHAILKKRPKTKTLFIDKRQETIEDMVIIIPELVTGKRIILIDETVISGLSLATVLGKISQARPREIHVRLVAHPMVRHCPWHAFSDNWSFISENHHNSYREHFGVDSFEYLEPEVLSRYASCTYCFGGKMNESQVVRAKAGTRRH